jgi:hypothetical protein
VTMGELANHVAENLPPGWTLKVSIQREAGWVSLYNPYGEKVTFPSNEEHIEEMVVDALECALSTQEANAEHDKLHGAARVVRTTEES